MGSAHPTLPAMNILLTLLVFVAPGLAISIEDSGIVCKEEGFHPHPTTCAKFYRCVKWSGELELVSCRWMQIVSSLANHLTEVLNGCTPLHCIPLHCFPLQVLFQCAPG